MSDSTDGEADGGTVEGAVPLVYRVAQEAREKRRGGLGLRSRVKSGVSL